MRLLPALFLFLLLSSLCTVASGTPKRDDLKRDTLFLYNGEVVIGQIQSMNLGVININSRGMGQINLNVDKIRTINSNVDTLRIETTSMAVYYGALRPTHENGKVYVVTEDGRYLVELKNINYMVSLHRRFVNNLEGNVTSGFSYSHSSGIGQLNVSAEVNYIRPKFELRLSATSMGSIDTSRYSRDRDEVTLSGYYNLHRKLYLFSTLDYQRNLQLSIKRRFQQTFGPAWKFVFNPSTQLIAFSGMSMNQELSTTGEKQNLLIEMPFGLQFNFFKFSHPNLQFTSSNTFYLSFSQWGRIRYDNTNTLSWEIINNLDLSISLYLNYDRRPPDNSNTGKIDYGIVQGFSYKF